MGYRRMRLNLGVNSGQKYRGYCLGVGASSPANGRVPEETPTQKRATKHVDHARSRVGMQTIQALA